MQVSEVEKGSSNNRKQFALEQKSLDDYNKTKEELTMALEKLEAKLCERETGNQRE